MNPDYAVEGHLCADQGVSLEERRYRNEYLKVLLGAGTPLRFTSSRVLKKASCRLLKKIQMRGD